MNHLRNIAISTGFFSGGMILALLIVALITVLGGQS